MTLERRILTDRDLMATDEKYFNISDDGVVSLKPEYQYDGSKNAELPEHVIIPDAVGEIPVTALAQKMFIYNLAVKRVTIPSTITELPAYFAYGAKNLKEVQNAENVTKLSDGAFYQSGITKALFPNLGEIGMAVFGLCPFLLIADLGSKITALSYQAFARCDKLHTLRAGGVTSIAEYALQATRRLKNPAFLPNLTTVGEFGLYGSRVNYDWSSLTGCDFTANNALMNKPGVDDWWSGCTFTECNTPMRSTFSQDDPRWKDEKVNNNEVPWSSGCLMVAAAMVYSAIAEVDLASPVEFVDSVAAVNPDALNMHPQAIATGYEYLRALGLTVEERNFNTSEDLQAMYDALASGKLIYGVMPAHSIICHGINANGEILVTDPDPTSGDFGISGAGTYAMPIQNLTAKGEPFGIVSKG